MLEIARHMGALQLPPRPLVDVFQFFKRARYEQVLHGESMMYEL